jgi:hypothetical protein
MHDDDDDERRRRRSMRRRRKEEMEREEMGWDGNRRGVLAALLDMAVPW